MITSLTTQSSSRWLTAVGFGNKPYFNSYSNGGTLIGAMRYDPTNGIQAYDGSTWHTLSGSGSVDLTYEAQQTLEWATKKRMEEAQLEKLMESHVGIRDAKEQLDIMIALAKKENNEEGMFQSP